jgi:hypothetical protein
MKGERRRDPAEDGQAAADIAFMRAIADIKENVDG